MTGIDSIEWPEVKKSELDFDDNCIYFGAIGFEDRACSFLKELRNKRKKLKTIFAIEYIPKNRRNRKEVFLSAAKSLTDDIQFLEYDRFSPNSFAVIIGRVAESIGSNPIIIDVSSMSKMAEIILLDAFAKNSSQLSVIYTEARVYHPTKRVFEKRGGRTIFRTRYVYSIISIPSPAGMSMQGSPLALVAFPNFNQLELRTLLNEISPQELFILEGDQPIAANHWRLDAIRELNREIIEFAIQKESVHEKIVSTRYYTETIDALEEIYEKTRYTHRLLISPTGSKMGALGVLLFKRIHPEIQIIYPVTSDFSAYTKGFIDIWQIDFGPFANFINRLEELRNKPPSELISKLSM